MGRREQSAGQRIKRLRRERGLTLRDVAGEGVSFSYLSRIERGQRVPSTSALRTIGAKLGVSGEYLETGRELPVSTERETRLCDAELKLRFGQPEEARRAFEKVLHETEEEGDAEHATRARLGLALAAAELGDHREAVSLLESAFTARRPLVTERPDLYAVLGRSYAAIGETPRAVTLFRQCLDEIEAAEATDAVLYVRFATYLSYALTDIGDLADAHDVLARALRHAEGVGDAYSLIRLYWSLGRFHERTAPGNALGYYRRAVALLEVTEDTFYLARAHEACASVLLDQDIVEGVREYLETAERLYLERGEGVALASVETEWARLHVRLEEPEEAKHRALRALDLLDRGGETFKVGDAWRALGEVFECLGDEDLAERAYRESVAVLAEVGPVHKLADACRCLGTFLHSVGRTGEAFDVLRRFAELTAESGPKVSGPDAHSTPTQSLRLRKEEALLTFPRAR